jgi:flotillin
VEIKPSVPFAPKSKEKMGNCNVVGPQEVLVVSGGCCASNGKKVVVGGCAWSWCMCTQVTKLSLNVMTLNPRCIKVETLEGVALTVTAVAQVMVSPDGAADMQEVLVEQPHAQGGGAQKKRDASQSKEGMLMTAVEQFAGKPMKDMTDAILQTLEGHLRAILGTMTVESIYKEREEFAEKVVQMATEDMENMGLKLISFVVKDLNDEVDYLMSLGKPDTAIVKKVADIGRAEARMESDVKSAEYGASRDKVRNEASTAVANYKREYDSRFAEFKQDSDKKKAEASLAYSLQMAKMKQHLAKHVGEITVVETKQQIEIETNEVIRMSKELEATVNKPADAEKYRVETIAEGEKSVTIMNALADASAIKLIGGADAKRILDVGEAEAEGMKVKADAFQYYGDAAIMDMIIDVLPKVASEVAAPLARTEDIVLMSGTSDGVSGEVTKLLSTLPPVVEATSGMDMKQFLQKLGSN